MDLPSISTDAFLAALRILSPSVKRKSFRITTRGIGLPLAFCLGTPERCARIISTGPKSGNHCGIIFNI